MEKNTNLQLGERSKSEGQIPTLDILNLSITMLTLIRRKEVVQISQPTERTLRIYCQPCLNNNENQAIRKFLETSLNISIDIKPDPSQKFIDFEFS